MDAGAVGDETGAMEAGSAMNGNEDLEEVQVEFRGQKPRWGWEYVLVFDNKGSDKQMERDNARTRIIGSLHRAGFQYNCVLSPDEEEILCRIALDESVLKEKAEAMCYKLKTLPKYGGGFLEFTREREDCFVNSERTQGGKPRPYFTAAERIKIVIGTIESPLHFGCSIQLGDEKHAGNITDSYAMHNATEQDEAIKAVVTGQFFNPLRKLDYEKIREYTGERVAMYFAFIDFFTKLQWILSVFAIPAYILYLLNLSEQFTAGVRLFFGLIVPLWSVLFSVTWTMREAHVRLRWGIDVDMSNDDEQLRSDVDGVLGYGFYRTEGFVKLQYLIDNCNDAAERARLEAELPQFPQRSRAGARKAVARSVLITLFFCATTAAVIFLLLWFKEDIVDAFGGPNSAFARFVPGALNALIMMLCEPSWKMIALKLTNSENNVTVESHNDSLILKRFGFLVSGYFIPLLYIAFAKQYNTRQQCINNWWGVEDCMGELEQQLLSVLVTRLTVSQLLEFAVPWIITQVKRLIAKFRQGKEVSDNIYVAERVLPQYESPMEDYVEVVLLYGFMVLFGLAFPIAATIIALNNMIELRADGYRIIKFHRRIQAETAIGIGVWYHIIKGLGFCGVLTNAAIICFTSGSITALFGSDDATFNTIQNVVSFFLIENVLFASKLLLDNVIPDIGWNTLKEESRAEFMNWMSFDVGFKRIYKHRPIGTELETRDERFRNIPIGRLSDDDSRSESVAEEAIP